MVIVTGDGHQAQRQADTRLGGAIRALRRERGLTLVELAAATGLSQPFLSQVELGRSRPSMRSLFRIATALDTTQQALLGLTTPAPTVRPPSRIANRSSFSIAIGMISSIDIVTLSPGITISVPAGNVHTPVTSVVRK